jgi:hypothetical protein
VGDDETGNRLMTGVRRKEGRRGGAERRQPHPSKLKKRGENEGLSLMGGKGRKEKKKEGMEGKKKARGRRKKEGGRRGGRMGRNRQPKGIKP